MAGKKISAAYVSWPKPSFATVVKTNKSFRTNFHMAMMYAHYEMSSSSLKKEVETRLRFINPKDPLLEKIKNIDEIRFITIGKYMYILNHGGEVPEDIFPKLIPALEKLVNEETEKNTSSGNEKRLGQGILPSQEKRSVDTIEKISIQDRLKEKAREVAGEIEGWIDDFCTDKKSAVKTVDEFVALFKASELKAPHMRIMNSIFQRRATEIAKAATGTDKELIEAYSNLNKAELKKFDQFHNNLLKACEMMQEVAKAERAPRKKKPVSIDKLIAKLKYKKEDSSLGIASANPIQIIGSKEVWVYNTKTRKLAQYKATDERGLSVKGSSLLNYSTESKEKTIRKPPETLSEFKKASKVKLRTFLKELSTLDVSANGKLNEHHIILRIDK